MAQHSQTIRKRSAKGRRCQSAMSYGGINGLGKRIRQMLSGLSESGSDPAPGAVRCFPVKYEMLRLANEAIPFRAGGDVPAGGDREFRCELGQSDARKLGSKVAP